MRKHNKRGTAAPSPAASDAAPVAVEATATAKPAPVRIGGFTLGNIARTAATVAALRTHYGAESNRDHAYILLFGDTADANGGTITLAALAAYGTNPYYTGSAKPHDAGAINRAIKAGNLSRDAATGALALTDTGRALLGNIRAKRA